MSSPGAGPSSAFTPATSPFAAPSFAVSGRSQSPEIGAGYDGARSSVELLTQDYGIQPDIPSSSQDDELDLFSTTHRRSEEILPFIQSRGSVSPGETGQKSPAQSNVSFPALLIPVTTDTVAVDREVMSSLDETETEAVSAKPPTLTRTSSLPPSSPPQSVVSIDNSCPGLDRGVSTESDAVLQSMHEVSIRSPSEPTPDPNTSLIQELVEDDASTKRYSFRSREARQLNPYSIEKQFYKEQMRNNPDALVKVVSPRRLEMEMERRNRSRQDEDYIVQDDETQGSPKRRRSREIENEKIVKDWLPDAFNMSDEDDLNPLQSLPPHHKQLPSRKHPHKFPMRRPKDLPRPIEEVHDTRNVESISYKRRKVSRVAVQNECDRLYK